MTVSDTTAVLVLDELEARATTDEYYYYYNFNKPIPIHCPSTAHPSPIHCPGPVETMARCLRWRLKGMVSLELVRWGREKPIEHL